MKEYSTKDIRNVVLLGATKSGKTTLAESVLYVGKVIDRKGTIEDKNTTSDYEEIEKLNQRSVYATPVYAEFAGCKVNVIDAPGSDDFCGGAFSAFKVCENGILVVKRESFSSMHSRESRLERTFSPAMHPRRIFLSSSQSTSSTPTRQTGRWFRIHSRRASEASL